jgi:indolepyruvate ferredoxin oxidoreductase
LARRFTDMIARFEALEQSKAAGRKGLSEAVARGYFKLLSYKDEYEVARLYTDGRFEKAVGENFDGDLKLEFHLAPPLMSWFSKDKVTGHPRKMSFGRWMLPVFRQLAKGRRLRGTTWDVFGYTSERKLERKMISDYEAVLAEIERRLSPDTYHTAVGLARLPEDIKGFGHVKLANYEKVKQREAALLADLRDPKPAPSLKAAE